MPLRTGPADTAVSARVLFRGDNFEMLPDGAAAATWVAGRHVWIQHQPPGTVPACGAPLDNLLQMFPLLEVIRKVMTGGGECGTIDWTMLGLSMPMWVLIGATTLGLLGIANNAFMPVRGAR